VHLVVVSTHDVQFVAHFAQTFRPLLTWPVGHAVIVIHFCVALSRNVVESHAQVPVKVRVNVALH